MMKNHNTMNKINIKKNKINNMNKKYINNTTLKNTINKNSNNFYKSKIIKK